MYRMGELCLVNSTDRCDDLAMTYFRLQVSLAMTYFRLQVSLYDVHRTDLMNVFSLQMPGDKSVILSYWER